MAIIPPELDHFYASNMDLEVILRSLTLPEKVTLLAGASTWRTAPVPRVNIPHLKVSWVTIVPLPTVS